MILKTNSLENTAVGYLPTIKKRTHFIYLTICFMVIAAIAASPFLYVDISLKSQGIVRPNDERTEIKPLISGIIDSIYVKEGRLVQKDSLIAMLKDNVNTPKKILNEYDISQRKQYVHDLTILISTPHISNATFNELQSPVYKQQVSQFIYQKADQEASIKKVNNEIKIDSILRSEKIIGSKEIYDKIIEGEKLKASYQAFQNQQVGMWGQDLVKYKLELSQLTAQSGQLKADEKQFEIRSPITGVVQGINSRYIGGLLQVNETLCIVSPETELIAECYVSTQDVGLLKIGQEAKFQIDAFDYNYFGIVTGKIFAIDNDFTVVDNKPIFKVKCSFSAKQLYLKNGFEGKLKKGLTFQSRFIIARRSLWQLLYDRIDDWLNPTSPLKINTESEKEH